MPMIVSANRIHAKNSVETFAVSGTSTMTDETIAAWRPIVSSLTQPPTANVASTTTPTAQICSLASVAIVSPAAAPMAAPNVALRAVRTEACNVISTATIAASVANHGFGSSSALATDVASIAASPIFSARRNIRRRSG